MSFAAIAPYVFGAASSLLGGHGKNKAELPEDLQGMRAQQIQLLQYLTGFGGPPAYFDPMRQGGGAHFPVGGSLADVPPPPRGNPIGQMRWAQQYGSPRAYQEAMKRQPRGNAPAGSGGAPQGYGAYNYAGGGMVYGPGGPKDDRVSAKLSNGEGVLTAEAVHTMGGPFIVHFLNAIAAAQQQPQHFAFGGVAGQSDVMSTLLSRVMQGQAPAGGQQGTLSAQQLGGASPMQPGALAGITGVNAGGRAPAPSMSPGANPGVTQFGGPMMSNVGTPQRLGPGPTLQGAPAGTAPPAGMGGPPSPDARSKSPAQQRLESYFGQLGVPTTGLQRQAVGGMEQFLASDPYKQAQTALNQILGSPGDAFRPDFERSLAQANQTGGRFGSANALMRSQALNDYNSAALKQAIAAAQGIQGLGAQQVNDMTSGYNMGSQYAGQLASGQQQAIQLLLSQLQTAQGASLNAPTQQQSTPFGQFAQGFGGFSQMLPYLYPSHYQPQTI